MPLPTKSDESRQSNCARTTRSSNLSATISALRWRRQRSISISTIMVVVKVVATSQPFLSVQDSSRCIAVWSRRLSARGNMANTSRVRARAGLRIRDIEVRRLHRMMVKWLSVFRPLARCVRIYLLVQMESLAIQRCLIWCLRKRMCSQALPRSTSAIMRIIGGKTIAILWHFRSKKPSVKPKRPFNLDQSMTSQLQIWLSIWPECRAVSRQPRARRVTLLVCKRHPNCTLSQANQWMLWRRNGSLCLSWVKEWP